MLYIHQLVLLWLDEIDVQARLHSDAVTRLDQPFADWAAQPHELNQAPQVNEK